MNPLKFDGSTPKWPLKPCKCGTVNCNYAIDQDGYEVRNNGILPAIQWPAIANAPGWSNGWPPGMGPNTTTSVKQASPSSLKIGQMNRGWNLVYPNSYPATLVERDLIKDQRSDSGPQKCDCGMAAADYIISRDGGAGHSSWCQVAGK